MNQIRRRLIRALEYNEGYFSDDGPFALEYTVATHRANCSIEKLSHIVRKDLDPDFELFAEPSKEELCRLYDQALESLQESISESSDCYREMQKDACTWVGLSAAVPLYFAARYSLEGRGGKHLCINSFQGRQLDISNATLVERLLDNDESKYFEYTNEWCRWLLAAMRGWDDSFSSSTASDMLEEGCAWELLGWNESLVSYATERCT